MRPAREDLDVRRLLIELLLLAQPGRGGLAWHIASSVISRFCIAACLAWACDSVEIYGMQFAVRQVLSVDSGDDGVRRGLRRQERRVFGRKERKRRSADGNSFFMLGESPRGAEISA